MALMTEERRKEMEEEMSRFELEIAVPGETKASPADMIPPNLPADMIPPNLPADMIPLNKPLSPPPPPPAVAILIPEVLTKAPPPPPPSSPPVHAPLRPPPPPPVLQPRVPAPTTSPIRFIPHQLHRHAMPPRPAIRPNFIGMRGPPIAGPPGHFPPPPGPMGPFVPPMSQGPPMAGPPMSGPPMSGPPMSGPPMSGPPMSGPPMSGPPMSGPPMSGPPMSGPPMSGPPMPPGAPMHMPPGSMPIPTCPPMPPQIGNMNVSLPMPPGFCPPSGPPIAPGPTLRCESQPFISTGGSQNYDTIVTTTSTNTSNEVSTVVASAPAVYAAPFMKSHSENICDSFSSTNGQEYTTPTLAMLITPKTEKQSVMKIADEPAVGPTVLPTSTAEEIVISKKKEKKKKIVRMAGGQAWEDNSLLEWDPDDFRIFCGDLGNDVTDEVLIRAFSKYQSFVKAKVIRDKRTNKTKGYGFVSFKDPQDFIKAMREMNGRYVGSRPIKLRKSTWRDRNIDLVKKKQREKEKLGLL